MEVIRDALERPVPPKEIVDALARIDDRLELRYVVSLIQRDYSNVNRDERWAILLHWTQDDKRRVMIQRGQMAEDADYDLLCYLPLDCEPANAYWYFYNNVKGQINDRRDLERLVSRTHLWNEKVTAGVKAEEHEHAAELIEANAPTLFEKEKGKIVKVYVKDNLK